MTEMGRRRPTYPLTALVLTLAALLAACTFTKRPEPAAAERAAAPPWEEEPALLLSLRQVSWWPDGWTEHGDFRYTITLARPEGQADLWKVLGWQDETGTFVPEEWEAAQSDPLQAAVDYAVRRLGGRERAEDFYLMETWQPVEEQAITASEDVSLEVTEVSEGVATAALIAVGPGEWIYGNPFALERQFDGVWYRVPAVSGNYVFTLEGHVFFAGEPTEIRYGLEGFCGPLPAGHYRIVTEVSRGGKDGAYTDYLLSAAFELPWKAA